MRTGKEEYDQALLDSLEKKYQLFLDSPNGEINVFLVLSKNEEDSKSEMSAKNSNNINSHNSYNNVSNYNISKPVSSFSNNILQPNRSLKNIQKNYNDSEMII
jgi:hypothetical protein